MRLKAGNMATGQLYSHIIPLVLLLVDGNFHSFYYSLPLFYAMFRLLANVVFCQTLVSYR